MNTRNIVNLIALDSSKLNEQCSVALNKIILSKIEMKCSVSSTSEKVLDLVWELEQQDSNNFTIRMKRRASDAGIDTERRGLKKVRFNDVTTHQQNNCMIESMYFIFKFGIS